MGAGALIEYTNEVEFGWVFSASVDLGISGMKSSTQVHDREVGAPPTTMLDLNGSK